MIEILSLNFWTVSSNLLLPVIHYQLFDFTKLQLEVVVLAPGCWDSEFKKEKMLVNTPARLSTIIQVGMASLLLPRMFLIWMGLEN